VYAIVKTGGRQFRVEQGDTIYVERVEAAVGDKLTLSDVLLVGGAEGVRVGTPSVPDAGVLARVVEQGRDGKIRVFKYKKRKHYRRTRGHRQSYTALQVEAIQG
jgi:large subunit ribosomal protein L21